MKKLKQLTEQQMKEGKKRFTKLLEYSFVNQEEDLLLDEDEDEDPNQSQEQPQPQGDDMGQPELETAPDQPQTEQPQTEQPPIELGQEPTQPQPQELPMGEPQAGEVEIDVTDLTTKQDDIGQKVESMSTQTSEMMKLLASLTDKVENIIQTTNSEMTKIKDEIVKRNPIKQEILQKRVVVSDPFKETPESYWQKKQAQGQYRLEDDDKQDEYEIKASTLDSNPRDVYKSFGLSDDEINQSLETVFRF